MLLPVFSGLREWGVLALCGPIETHGSYSAQRPNNIALLGALLGEPHVEYDFLVRGDVPAVWFRSTAGQPSREAIDQRLHPADRERVHNVHKTAVLEKVDFEHEYRIVLPDGTVKHGQATCHPVSDPDGSVVELRGTARDVTERKQAEQALREAQAALAHVTRVTTLGEVTASIAHEVKQPLAAIVANAAACLNLLANGGQGGVVVRDVLADIANDAERASDIIERVRALAKRSVPEQVEVRPIDVVHD